MDSYYDTKCTTCGHPEVRGYRNVRANEQCCDPCHGPHLAPTEVSTFCKFHGRKAKKMMRRSF